MPLLTSSDIKLAKQLEGAIKPVFNRYLYDYSLTVQYPKIAMEIPSSGSQESYSWFEAVPKMKEFIDERYVQGLTSQAYTLPNKKWEATIGVSRDVIEDDQLGQIRPRIQLLAEEAIRHRDQMIFELMANGDSETLGKCYDDKPFFSTNHPTANGEVSNKGNSELSATALQATITAMMKFVDSRGTPLGIVPDTLVVPPDLQWKAKELLQSVYYPEADNLLDDTRNKRANNVLQGSLDLIVSPYLTNAKNWYVLCAKMAYKPFILQVRTPIEFTSLEANSETGFMRDEFVYGVRSRYNAGYALWQLGYANIVA